MNNQQALIKRTLTGLILAPLTIWAVLALPKLLLAVAIGFVMLIAAWEWGKFMALKHRLSQLVYLIILTLVCSALYYYALQQGGKNFSIAKLSLLICLLFWVAGFIWVLVYATKKTRVQNTWLLGLVGIVILAGCWLGLNAIRWWGIKGEFYLLYLLLLVWLADMSAYFFGRQWGKRKLIPAVSPGKSQAGVGGALLIGLLFAIIAGWSLSIPWHVGWLWLLWSLFTVIVSVVGDLFFSVMKRQSELKDSGKLLPGHGGVLDRIDSLTAAAPLFAFGWMTLIHAYL